jgi:hypothetical protein
MEFDFNFDSLPEHILFADYDDDTSNIEVDSAAFVYAVEYVDKPEEMTTDYERFTYGLQYLADNGKLTYLQHVQHRESAKRIYDHAYRFLTERTRLIDYLEFTIKGGKRINDLAKFKKALKHLKSYH